MDKLTRYSFFFFSFLLPLNTWLSNFFIIAIITVLFLNLLVKKEFPRLDATAIKKLSHSTVPLFLLLIYGLFIGGWEVGAFRFFEKSISFLLLPLLLFNCSKLRLKKYKQFLLDGLVYGCLVCSLILLSNQIIRIFWEEPMTNLKMFFDYYHTGKHFVSIFEIHPTYLGFYILCAVVNLKNSFKHRVIILLVRAIFIITILFINSRILIFLTVIWLFIKLYDTTKFLLQRYGWIRTSLSVSAMILIVIFTLTNLKGTYMLTKFKSIFDFELSVENEVRVDSNKLGNPRMARWMSVLKLISKKPFFGYGTTKEQTLLNFTYEQNGLRIAAQENYNTHNQYLSYWLRFGILGLTALFLFLFKNFLLAFRHKDFFYVFLFFSLSVVCLTENFLDRNFGITFVAVFSTIFSFSILDNQILNK